MLDKIDKTDVTNNLTQTPQKDCNPTLSITIDSNYLSGVFIDIPDTTQVLETAQKIAYILHYSLTDDPHIKQNIYQSALINASKDIEKKIIAKAILIEKNMIDDNKNRPLIKPSEVFEQHR